MTITRRFVLMLLPALACCLTGCESGGHFAFLGYTTQPTFDPQIRSIYVPIAQNISYKRGIEFDLTTAVQREIGTVSPYRLVADRSRADTELLMTVVNTRKAVILQNQAGETRDAEVGLIIEVVWKDLRLGRAGDILSNPKRFDPNQLPLPGEAPAKAPSAIPIIITPTALYIPELGGSNASAERKAVEGAARQIVANMEIWR